MKVVILAGGKGTRLAEETSVRPKPMVEVGGKPVLWHLMKIYAAHGFTEFLVACGYKGEMIKEYFHNFPIHSSDFFLDLATGDRTVVNGCGINWSVGVIDTGADTMTGGRIRRLRKWIGDDPFMVTYGDGLGDINICALAEFHRSHGKIATVTAVRPPSRFGNLTLQGSAVCEFMEKPQTDEGWINGGFFVFNPEIFDYLEDDLTVLEKEPLEDLAQARELMAFRHPGFWQPMDTLRERQLLDSLWSGGQAPWKVWS
jgi:glucose-1-phosphate cytidylyltransferase